jgi:Family of unknown function (DUF6283)
VTAPAGTIDAIAGPAAPCLSCPYRCDVPSGIWAADEYAKLTEYDRPTGEQPPAIFICHQDNGRLCSGWVGCHDMAASLALRIASGTEIISADVVSETLVYVSPVPLWGSGAAAAAHGIADINDPSPSAVKMITKIRSRRGQSL